MTVLLVRHAAAGSRRDWDGDDERRPLTPRGVRQADALVEQLAGYAIDVIVCSPALRCLQTVAPIARARGLDVEESELLAEGSGIAGLRLVSAAAHVLLCGHGDNLPEILFELAGDLPSVERDASFAKGSTWVLQRRDSTVTSAQYIEPPT